MVALWLNMNTADMVSGTSWLKSYSSVAVRRELIPPAHSSRKTTTKLGDSLSNWASREVRLPTAIKFWGVNPESTVYT